MNVKPDDETYTALSRMAQGAEWEVVEKWLLKNREDCVKRSLSSDEVQSRQAQGSLMAIDEFVRITRAAVELSTRR